MLDAFRMMHTDSLEERSLVVIVVEFVTFCFEVVKLLLDGNGGILIIEAALSLKILGSWL